MKVYISGQITGRPLDEARDQFAAAADELKLRGHEPVNPFDVPPPAGCACPGRGDLAGAGGLHAWECYLRGDLVALLGCDAILLLPGWQRSQGARRELSTATTAGIDVWWQMPESETAVVLREVAAERERQDARWGEQNHPDGTDVGWKRVADGMRVRADMQAKAGLLTWRDIAEEEVWEAYAETDPAKLRAELVQGAAVFVAWIEAIDRRSRST